MVVPAELLASRPRLRVKYGRKSSAAVGRDKRAQLRRATEEDLAQRLYSIILAVHAAEHELGENPERLAAILELIHLQSAASLEDLRRLGALG